MSTATDPATLASRVIQDADNDLATFFGHFAADCRFRWGNGEAVQGLEAIQELVARQLAGVAAIKHDVVEELVGDDSAALRMDVTYTRPDGGTMSTPAVTYMRFRDGRVCEYLIYQDPTPLIDAAARLEN